MATTVRLILDVTDRYAKASRFRPKTSYGPPTYTRRPAGSIVDAVEPRIRELLAAFPTMPATVIAERVGWSRDALCQLADTQH